MLKRCEHCRGGSGDSQMIYAANSRLAHLKQDGPMETDTTLLPIQIWPTRVRLNEKSEELYVHLVLHHRSSVSDSEIFKNNMAIPIRVLQEWV